MIAISVNQFAFNALNAPFRPVNASLVTIDRARAPRKTLK